MFDRITYCLGAGFVIALGLLTLPSGTQAQSNEFRAVWVDAWGTGFLNASQVTQLIADCRTYNFNSIIVQMRRRGDAFYTPGIGGNDPKTTAIASGFDALQDVITKAHDTSGGKPRIEVHCWVTTHVIWSSITPPSQAGHIINLHPEYLMRDSAGTNYLAEGFYLDPGHPDATMWNYVMATNIVRRYDVDGFHWDYIRYPQADSGYNPTAIARYNAEFGLSGQPSPSDVQFSDWRRRQISDFLRWVNSDLLSYKSNLVISTAVFGSRSDAYSNRFQDWAGWNNEGIIDICMPMGYTADNALFQSRVTDAFNNQGVRRVYSGQGAYLNTMENTVSQLDYIRGKPLLGSVLYSYRTPNSGTVNILGTLTHVRDNHQPTWVDVPVIPWKATPTKGIIRGTVTRQTGGVAVYNANLVITTSPARNQKTEPHGKFAFFETPPGTYTITVTAADLATLITNVTIAAGQNLALNLVLPPDNTPPVISDIAANTVSDSSATITWTTDENSNSAVDYGPSATYGSVASNATMTVNHSIPLDGLVPNTTYHFRVRSRNPSNLQTNSADMVFVTNPVGVVNDVVVESRLAGGGLNVDPPYSDSDASFDDSTLKSTAAGLTGTGSRYAVSGTPTYTLKPTLPVVGGSYDVYLTHGVAASISDDIVVAVSQAGCSGLPATTTIFREPGGNTWEFLGRLKLNPGVSMPSITFTYSSGSLVTGSRMYSDAGKFVFVPPPLITAEPLATNVNQGAHASFSVSATGAPPLAYQWRYEGTNLVGKTGSSFLVTNVQPTQEGAYSVVITNAVGSVTSSVASLTVNIPPTIASPPQSQSAVRGDDVTFSVTTGGTEPLVYQWRFNGTNISGATSDSYTRSNVQPNDAGNYAVSVTNLAGAATSSDAVLLVVLPQPLQFQAISLLPDRSVRLTLSGQAGASYAIDTSSNLTSWIELMTGILTNSPMELLDDAGSNAGVRFYRAR